MHMDSKRTTLIIRADLLSAARAATGIPRKTDLIHAGLEALIERAAAEHLAGLAGKGKDFAPAPRRRKAVRAGRRVA